MIEIRFHGRGGQGTVVASKVLADAAGQGRQLRPGLSRVRRRAARRPRLRLHPHRQQAHLRQEPDLRPGPRRRRRPDAGRGDRRHRGPQGRRLDHHQQRQDARGFQVPRQVPGGHDQRHRRSPSGTSWARWPRRSSTRPSSGPWSRSWDLTKLESLVAAIREGIPIKPEDNVQAAEEAYEKA